MIMAGVFLIAAAIVSGSDRPLKPNVVLILADDLGWQDVKCYDIDEPSPYETPNIDRLAKSGTLFRQAYSPAPTCAPSRCAIISGNHPARAQKTHVVGGGPPMPYNITASRVMTPWYSGRMPANEMTIARVLQQNGYATGHCGKWHMAIDHHAYPQPEEQGFDWTRHDRGVTIPQSPHRLTDFATRNADDPYMLDQEGFPYDQNSEDALEFLRLQNEKKPFFLYYATWLVHTPIHTRSKALLDKYVKKLGVNYPADPKRWEVEGQNNPYYCAMVEMLDHYVGKLIVYLEQAEDPRWPGHKLIENTYIIFTSDNGGMERHPGEIITDNAPLDQGKISTKEGGTRVPLIIVGPGIPKGRESNVMVNGLDFYPTIVSWVKADLPASKHLDGCDISTLLSGDCTDAALVKDASGAVRDTMVWHFPHSVDMRSTIRVGDYKLIRNYDYVGNAERDEFELYRLYNSDSGKAERVDIEEAKDLAKVMPEKTKALNTVLTRILTEMKASYPYYNPHCKHALPNKEKVCEVVSHEQKGSSAVFKFKENGAKVVQADLLYTLNGGQRYEEWFRKPAELQTGFTVQAELPKGTTHYVINLIDENNFLRSYPEMSKAVSDKGKYSADALKVDLAESLAPLEEGKAPQNFEQLWAGYDPSDEPLDIEVLKEWEEDGVVLKILRYRIGVFKGQ